MVDQSLSQRLVSAKLAGSKVGYDHYSYQFRSNEQAAELALLEFSRYLAEEVARLLAVAAVNEEATGRSVQLIKAETLNDLASKIAQEAT